MNPEICPNCGADVPNEAKSCPECGSCEETGWSDDATLGRLGISDDSFDYNEFVEREFGPGGARPRGMRGIWGLTGLVLLGAMLFWIVFIRR